MKLPLIVAATIFFLSGCVGPAPMPEPALVEPAEVAVAEPQYPDDTELDRALRRLVADLETAVMSMSDDGSDENKDGAPGKYMVQEGDYLDLIIKRTMADSPINESMLRRAFVSANPHAFKRSNPNWLFAKKELRIPTVADFKRIIFRTGGLEQMRGKNKDPRAGWVQYP
ncbi:MAG TPA: hypothetical protein DER02_08160 [Gammaproteobacteria bacterium]|jgi:Tfp pilus assembly protein FimV|nr:hypothetical protein [Gammaproteobacteria bacterium]|tara:strand:- start:19589 stop:20098 length:510 start_codon:yes stop_codon:yes gene_type:complete